MKKLTPACGLAGFIGLVSSLAMAQTPPQIIVRKDVNGKDVATKATGRYTDCVKDGQDKLGYSKTAVVAFCDRARREGRVK